MKLQNISKILKSNQNKAKLHIFNKGGAGFLELKLVNDSTIKIFLEKRYVQLLILSSDVIKKDSSLDEQERGWLTNEKVVDMYQDIEPMTVPPEPAAISAYRSHINSKIRKASENKLPRSKPPILFISIRNLGFRLVSELEIIEH